MHLIISTSLNPNSKSRILANAAAAEFQAANVDHQLVDLAELSLPMCDGAQCYAAPDAQKIAGQIKDASSILLACPVYNYDVSAAAKNLIELSGKAWTEKVVGFLLAAGGQGSYMGVMGIANSLMLDFRSLILPKFVYATGEHFSGNEISDPEIEQRIKELTEMATRLSEALAK